MKSCTGLFPCSLDNTSKLILINIAELLEDLLPRIIGIDDISQKIKAEDLESIPPSLIYFARLEDRTGFKPNSFHLESSILRLEYIIHIMVNESIEVQPLITFQLLTLIDRLKALHKQYRFEYFMN